MVRRLVGSVTRIFEMMSLQSSDSFSEDEIVYSMLRMRFKEGYKAQSNNNGIRTGKDGRAQILHLY